MSVYKEPLEWIRESIDSILNQTFKDFEFIIVDDNPGDDKLLVFLKEYEGKDERIILLQNEKNRGLPYCLNKALDHSKGVYVARMDADDVARPGRFSAQVRYLDSHTETAICGCCAHRFGDIPLWSDKSYYLPEDHDEIRISSLFQSPMIHPSIMAHKDIIVHYRYDESLRKAQDYELWSRLLEDDLKFYNLPYIYLNYRETHKSHAVSSKSQQVKVADQVRLKLLISIGINVSDEESLLHNAICEGAKCNVTAAEQWLLKLNFRLKQLYPSKISYIDSIISRQWLRVTLCNGISFSRYRQSVLPHFLALRDVFRFMRWAIKKIRS